MAKAKVRVKFDAGKLEASIVGRVRKLLNDDELYRQVGSVVVERVRLQAKRAKPLNDEGRFPELQPETKLSRNYLRKFNKTADVFSVPRSNVSLTGQLLNSLRFIRDKSGFSGGFLGRLIFFGARIPYRTGPKSVAKLTAANRTNEALARTLESIGFVVVSKEGVEKSDALIKRIRNTVRSYIRRKLR